MDIGVLASAIAAVSRSKPPHKADIHDLLIKLLSSIKHSKRGLASDRVGMLTHATLAVAIQLSHPFDIPDAVRDCCLECLYEALTPNNPEEKALALENVHVVVVERLANCLSPLFSLQPNNTKSLSSETRFLAIKCWRLLFVQNAVKTIAIPIDSNGSRCITEDFSTYFSTSEKRDYIAFCICSLLDNASDATKATSPELRGTAIKTIGSLVNSESGIFRTPSDLRPLLPGITSDIIRIVLDKLRSKDAHENESQVTEWVGGSKKTFSFVKANALDVLSKIFCFVLSDSANEEFVKNERKGSELLSVPSVMASSAKQVLKDGPKNGDRHDTLQDLNISKVGGSDKGSGPVHKWLKETDEKVHKIVRSLADLRFESDARIKKSLIHFCSKIIFVCPNVLRECVGISVEICLLLFSDNDKEVTSTVRTFISKLKKLCQDNNYYLRLVKHRFEQTLELFPTLVSSHDSRKRQEILTVLSGYMSILGSVAGPAIESSWGSTLLPSFLSSLKMQSANNTQLVTTTNNVPNTLENQLVSTKGPLVLPVSFESFRTPELQKSVADFIDGLSKSLGYKRLCQLWVEPLHDSLYSETYRSQLLWLSNKCVGQLVSDESFDRQDTNFTSTIQIVLRESIDALAVCAKNSEEEEGGGRGYVVQTKHFEDRVLETCIVLDCLSTLSKALGPSVIYYLDEMIFPLLKVTAQSSTEVQPFSRALLLSLAKELGCSDIQSLLIFNIDYIVQGCSQQLRHSAGLIASGTFEILSAMATLSDKDIIPYFDDIVEDVLDICEEDIEADPVVTPKALRFMNILTRQILEWEFGNLESAKERRLIEHRRTNMLNSAGLLDQYYEPEDESSNVKEIRCLFRQQLLIKEGDTSTVGEKSEIPKPNGPNDFQKIPISPKSNLDTITYDKTDNNPENINNEDSTENEGGLEEKEIPLTLTQSLDMRIALVVQNLAASSSSIVQCETLAIIRNVLPVLSPTKELLPLINEIWPTLSRRLTILATESVNNNASIEKTLVLKNGEIIDDISVTLAACQVIQDACIWGGDWMRQRVRDDLLPAIHSLLKTLASKGRGHTIGSSSNLLKRSASINTPTMNLACSLFDVLEITAESVPFDDEKSWKTIIMLLPFFDASVHEKVANKAKEVLITFGKLFPDQLWLILQSIGGDQVFIPKAPTKQMSAELPTVTLEAILNDEQTRTLPQRCENTVKAILSQIS
ncbi:hypothetical protein H4219_002875 [Mycoemilia scoparia]|uniref:Uncharacterized protein n=1 Tax=Mycoemilia scoparia TaxID=417184 RepID=A0A9W7ZWC3_9FUNG|nr:hypothetical protein H4219_002875 [Mycoemilia scoparia]